jgi:hypothetical protein
MTNLLSFGCNQRLHLRQRASLAPTFMSYDHL